jgi:hypothetical protein
VEDMFGNQDGGEVEEEKCVLALGIEFLARFFAMWTQNSFLKQFSLSKQTALFCICSSFVTTCNV